MLLMSEHNVPGELGQLRKSSDWPRGFRRAADQKKRRRRPLKGLKNHERTGISELPFWIQVFTPNIKDFSCPFLWLMWLGLCPQIIDWQAQNKMREISDENNLVCSSKFDKGAFGNSPFPHKRELLICCVLGYLYHVLGWRKCTFHPLT